MAGPTPPRDRDNSPGRAPARDENGGRTGRSAAESRIREQHRWVELQIQRALERGDFDDLPGAGKPLPDLSGGEDWWLKKLVEREQITGVLPEALQLRKDDAALDAVLDRENTEQSVRDQLEAFNRRVIAARRQLLGGPPVITPLRDIDAEVEAWRERRRRS
jgi:hypothetical protein